MDVKIILKIQVGKHIPKVGKHIPSGFWVSTITLFKSIENKHDVSRGKGCMEKLCESLREQPMGIINFKNKKTK